MTSEVQGDKLVTSIADRGPGIDSFEQSLIFEKFYRGQNQRYSAPGTGMGLAIAKVIVEAHGGTIGVVSQLGAVRVFVYLASGKTPASVMSNASDGETPS